MTVFNQIIIILIMSAAVYAVLSLRFDVAAFLNTTAILLRIENSK